MNIYLIRHGKSDKSLEHKLPHDEFERTRPIIESEVEKARQLGLLLKKQNEIKRCDLVWSGKERSKQTLLAIADGLSSSSTEARSLLREDFGLSYLADEQYWKESEKAVKEGKYQSQAGFFLKNPPREYFKRNSKTSLGQTFSAQYMQQNMRSVIRRAIERNKFLGNDFVVMVSHEPVISLCMSDLSGKSVVKLGGECALLEFAQFLISFKTNSLIPEVELLYRDKHYDVGVKLFKF